MVDYYVRKARCLLSRHQAITTLGKLARRTDGRDPLEGLEDRQDAVRQAILNADEAEKSLIQAAVRVAWPDAEWSVGSFSDFVQALVDLEDEDFLAEAVSTAEELEKDIESLRK